ncbi:MAG: hypothetical protein ACREFD_18305 [Stellaceae bacterium]
MEQKKWETAIRCLEIALHPNTGDEEVIAGVNGFRRTANGTPLSYMWRAFASTGEADSGRVAESAKWRAKLERLNQENIQLHLRLDAEQRAAAHRLQAAEEHIRTLTDEMMAFRLRASEAERRLADLQPAYREMPERVTQSSARSTPAAAEPAAATPLSQFQSILTAARQHGDDPIYPAAALNRNRTVAPEHPSRLAARAPWTA